MKSKVWVDADACPKSIKEILFKAAKNRQIITTFVANQFIKVPPFAYIKQVTVSAGFDKADDYIENAVCKNDVVITSDLPLAEHCLNQGAKVISFRGELFSLSTIKQKLAMRDFNETMRASGIHSSGPKAQSAKDVNQFANQFDKALSQLN